MSPLPRALLGTMAGATALLALACEQAAGTGQQSPAENVVSTDQKAEDEWYEVAAWKDNGAKQTEPFRIDRSPWVIEWTLGQGSYDTQLLQVFVYGEEEFPDVAVNTLKAGSDRTYMYGKGTYHLQMNAMGSWTVRVLSTGSSAARPVALPPTATPIHIPTLAPKTTARALPTATPALTLTPKGLQLTSFGDGTYTVGVDIKPGNYKTEIALEMGCHWTLTLENGNLWSDGGTALGPGIVPISIGDRSLTTKGCGTWQLLESTGQEAG